ncbi:carbohydrate ABC transporter permease [Prauserella cavernicola]|uniref:Carbohydrate ABC transporter permease n=1 Tax=Prauserella cavernicola TaxID=2800127 RepID=A0A934QW33_9PSEU|nr:carbohydrate ABC transporter permease [Prauserella cavernicola]MBK1787473.1 carbohydrate ABC transporter permease [Prauserella cavernicola]
MKTRRSALSTTALVAVGVLLAVWTLLPVYHMLVVSLSPSDELFAGRLWPEDPTLTAFSTVLTEGDFTVERFWLQLWNSLFVAVVSAVGVLAIATLAAFAVARLRPRWAGLLTTSALATYVIPLSFLAIPLYKAMANYNLLGSQWALILATITFGSPYALWVLSQYARASIPSELDEAATIDGAGAWRIYFQIFLPLMRPPMVVVGIYAFLLAWNEYLMAFLFLSEEDSMTLPVTLGNFLNSDQIQWNVMMATALFYALPPVLIYYAFQRNVSSGSTAGGVKN